MDRARGCFRKSDVSHWLLYTRALRLDRKSSLQRIFRRRHVVSPYFRGFCTQSPQKHCERRNSCVSYGGETSNSSRGRRVSPFGIGCVVGTRMDRLDRRTFIATSAAATAAMTVPGGSIMHALGAADSPPSTRLDPLRHRFGVNYTPSHNWWFCWNDWNPDPIKRDLDAIASLGADHLRILLVWPFFPAESEMGEPGASRSARSTRSR